MDDQQPSYLPRYNLSKPTRNTLNFGNTFLKSLFLTEESKTLFMSVNKLRKKCFRIYVQTLFSRPNPTKKIVMQNETIMWSFYDYNLQF